jgi:uncharacterized protein YqgC (DUF456 family)
MNHLADVLLFVGMLIGLVVIPFGLPGAAIILISVLIYAILTGFAAQIGVALFIMLAILTLIAETADNWLTALGARRFGASSGSIWLSLLGGLLGAILFGAPLAFVMGPLGPVVGGFAGAFLIVFLYEYSQQKDARQAFRAGMGAFVGRMAGIMLKLVIAVGMVAAVVAAFLF